MENVRSPPTKDINTRIQICQTCFIKQNASEANILPVPKSTAEAISLWPAISRSKSHIINVETGKLFASIIFICTHL